MTVWPHPFSSSLVLEGVGRLPSTARIERAQFHRARSASKEGTWPLPPHPSEAARCASTGIVPATPSPFFSILLDCLHLYVTLSPKASPEAIDQPLGE